MAARCMCSSAHNTVLPLPVQDAKARFNSCVSSSRVVCAGRIRSREHGILQVVSAMDEAAFNSVVSTVLCASRIRRREHGRLQVVLAVDEARFSTSVITVACAGRTRRPEYGRLKVVSAMDDEGAASKKGQQLWRKELRLSDEVANDLESFDEEKRQRLTMERDIERLTRKEEVEKMLRQGKDGSTDGAGDRGGGAVRDFADKILVADFFFILLSLAWLVAGLAERTALESSTLLDAWLPLWPSVFQPALGVFMAGAIMSAVTKGN